MGLNCKPGDLAIGIGAVPEKLCNIGSIVRVLHAHPYLANYWTVYALNSFVARGKRYPAGTIAMAEDKYLRPLRGEGGEDEVLRLVGRHSSAALEG